jgi:hypothetical protein
MSIFRKASELNKLPESVTNAYFESNEAVAKDEFEEILKTASSNQSVYQQRVDGFKKTASKDYKFEKPQPTNYEHLEGGIRRVGYGKRFDNENSEMFGQNQIRSLASNDFNPDQSELSIWDPEFDVLQSGFEEGQKVHDSIYDRRTMAEKKAQSNRDWEREASASIRKSNVLPHRGLGIVRTSNEQPIHHNNLNTFDEFYAETHDNLRGLTKKSNEERKAQISRQGYSPEEKRDMWQNKEALEVRTIESMARNSFLEKFSQGYTLDE